MAYNLRARALWDRTIDYRAVIRDVCTAFYGPAAQSMFDYYILMDQAYLDYWQQNAGRYRRDAAAPYSPLEFQEFSFATLANGRTLLEEAWAAAADAETLHARLAAVRFGHALITYTIGMTSERTKRTLTAAEVAQAREAWDLARSLRRDYRLMVARSTSAHLKAFRISPPTSLVQALPIRWRFRTDPEDLGLEAKWYRKPESDAWTDIRTDEFWTRQGHAYHGAAWYAVEFTLSEAAREQLAAAAKAGDALGSAGHGPALFFGAVDGYADIFLDGEKIGEQKEPPGVMWDQPFLVPLPKDFVPDAPHRLLVRVEKDSQAAGIWRPVRIVIVDE